MPSLSFQDADIRKIDAKKIPPIFLAWYQTQSKKRKEEVRKLNPRLVAAITGEPLPESVKAASPAPVLDASPEQSANVFDGTLTKVSDRESADVSGEEEVDPVQDAWESVPWKNWNKTNVDVPVLVCKVMPEGNRVCHFHSPRVSLKERFLKIRTPDGAVQGVRGYYCPECMDFYMEQVDLDETIPRISKVGIAGRVQPLGVTLEEWKRDGVSNEWKPGTPVYYPKEWKERGMTCPVHPEEVLRPDDYRIRYKDRELIFQAYFCGRCDKFIMRQSIAEQLKEDCGEAGIPAPEFYPLVKRKLNAVRKKTVRPDEVITDGRRKPYSGAGTWEMLGEEDTVVISYSASCPELDHEEQCEDVWCVISVMEKKGGRKNCLIRLCYCKECERYYGVLEDLKAALDSGRPEVNLLNDTDSDCMITSGEIFALEKKHLGKLESKLNSAIDEIQESSGYTGQYETNRYGYDDGNLAFSKHLSRTNYEELKKLKDWKSKPYLYRADLTRGEETKTFYLGASEINLDGGRQVMSFYSGLGKEMVNSRTAKMRLPDGKEYQLTLLRWFDIKRASLFGYANQLDKSDAFSTEIRDEFLRKVLRMRRRQHQLLDIISTIQKEQDAIIDLPLQQNLIVQGCAGSGKTMVMLHRLSSLQATNPAFRPDAALILTPNQSFNLHIDGLAESLQIQYIPRYSVENYYAKVLEAYDPSFHTRGKISDEMADNQQWVDQLYSERFFDALIEETDAAMKELGEYLADVLPLPLPASVEAAKGAQLLPIFKEAVSASERDMSAKDNAYQQCVQECQRLEKRISELDADAPKVQAEAVYKVMEEVQKARGALEAEIARQTNRAQSLAEAIAGNEEELRRVETSLFRLNRAKKAEALRGIIAASAEELHEVQATLEKLRGIPDFSAMSPEEIPAGMESASQYFPELHFHSQAIARELQRENDRRQEAQDTRIRLERARLALDKAMSERYADVTRQEIEGLKKQVGTMTHKALYERALSLAAKKEGVRAPVRNATRRYDLYLQLRYAFHYFGAPSKQYSLICVDEGQDLTRSEYRLIRNLNGNGAVFNIYGDTRQLLKTGRGIGDWKKDIAGIIPAPEIRSLNQNYRNTNQITEYCNNAFRMEMVKTGIDGTSVRELRRGELETALSNLNADGERVAVILPRAVTKETYLNRDALPDGISAEPKSEPGKIALAYADEVKGVEFDRVFVIPNSMSDNERYIAFTRALSHLTLVFDSALDSQISDEKSADSSVTKEKRVAKSAETRKAASADGKIQYGKVRKRPKIIQERGNAGKNRVSGRQKRA